MSGVPKGQLAKRLTFSAIFVSITIWAIFFAPFWLFFTVVLLFSLLALSEFFALAEKKNVYINRWLGLSFGAVLPFAVMRSSESAVLAAACLFVFVFHFFKKEKDQALLSAGMTIFGLVYVSWFVSHLILMKNLPSANTWIFYTILLVKGGDAGAYFIGKNYGKTKLIEHVSPNKSVEGSIACIVTTVLLSLISKLYLPQASFANLLIMGLGLGVLSQLGDLAESLIKREAGVKDSGSIPGLGGILDVLDSLVLTLPFIYYYILHFVLQVPF